MREHSFFSFFGNELLILAVYRLVLRKSLLATSIQSQYDFGLYINGPDVEGIREDK